MFNGFNDVLIILIDTGNVAILNIYCVHYRCIIFSKGKNEAINLFKNSELIKKINHYKNLLFLLIKNKYYKKQKKVKIISTKLLSFIE